MSQSMPSSTTTPVVRTRVLLGDPWILACSGPVTRRHDACRRRTSLTDELLASIVSAATSSFAIKERSQVRTPEQGRGTGCGCAGGHRGLDGKALGTTRTAFLRALKQSVAMASTSGDNED